MKSACNTNRSGANKGWSSSDFTAIENSRRTTIHAKTFQIGHFTVTRRCFDPYLNANIQNTVI